MAIVKKKVAPSASAKEEASAPASVSRYQRPQLSLNKYKPSGNFFDYNILIYGERKVGKTTLVSQCPGVYFFLFEPNKSYALYGSEILSWEDFNCLADDFVKGGHPFQTSIIDGGKICYNMALKHACKKFGFEHPGGQKDYGQSWAKVNNEFEIPVRKLMSCQHGFLVIAHQKEKDVETAGGGSFSHIEPDLSGRAAEIFGDEIYNIFYYYKDKEGRWLQIEGDDYIQCGHRMKGHFLTPAGERVIRIPMGDSEEEGYRNLMLAFDNKQKDPYVKKGGTSIAEDKSESMERGKLLKKKRV